MCLVCLYVIMSLLFKAIAVAISPKFRTIYKCLNRNKDRKWETWSGLLQMTFPAKLQGMVFGPALLS